MRTGLGSMMQARKGNNGAEMRNRLTSVLLGTLVHKGSANDPRNKQGRDAFEGKKILQAHKSSKKGGMA